MKTAKRLGGGLAVALVEVLSPSLACYVESAMGWTVKWTVSVKIRNPDSQAGLLSSLLSISGSKRMVLDRCNRRNRLMERQAKSFRSW